MAKKFLLGSLIIGTLSLVSCGGSGNSDPAAYNNEIITVINGSETNISEMNTAMAGSDYVKAEEVRGKWDKQLDADIKKVENLGDFKGDASFQTAVLTGLKGYKKIVTESYPKLIEIRKIKPLILPLKTNCWMRLMKHTRIWPIMSIKRQRTLKVNTKSNAML